jgi:hypothetical protein
MGDEARGRMQQRLTTRDQRRLLHRPLPRHGPDLQPAAALPDVVERLDAAEIDQQTRSGQPHVEHRHQALTACEDFGVAVEGRERGDRLPQRRRSQVLEGSGLHLDLSAEP